MISNGSDRIQLFGERPVVQLKSIKAYATIPKGMMGCGCSLGCIVKFTSFQRDGRRCYEYLFACVKRNKMDSELLTCFFKFIEHFPDYLSALSRTLLCFFGQPLSKQLHKLGRRRLSDRAVVCIA